MTVSFLLCFIFLWLHISLGLRSQKCSRSAEENVKQTASWLFWRVFATPISFLKWWNEVLAVSVQWLQLFQVVRLRTKRDFIHCQQVGRCSAFLITLSSQNLYFTLIKALNQLEFNSRKGDIKNFMGKLFNNILLFKNTVPSSLMLLNGKDCVVLCLYNRTFTKSQCF